MGAHLQGANLRGADLIFADLTGANLRGADLHGVTGYSPPERPTKEFPPYPSLIPAPPRPLAPGEFTRRGRGTGRTGRWGPGDLTALLLQPPRLPAVPDPAISHQGSGGRVGRRGARSRHYAPTATIQQSLGHLRDAWTPCGVSDLGTQAGLVKWFVSLSSTSGE
ncbi:MULTISPECIES: pentapeptide repeat-containing protein [unclassified Streptomyces]|uniref:pentapeptide repeat-containing protein n=1 Tax=unclassified Streptomyces TaxID=2593676 RepID=UPI0022AFC627|nr:MULTISPECIES: pentapeptide repeat-containing protein [unclassified Streptomyces]MCZ4102312.1 pentapeptide repeat-containing protein [Streptomyces sp. H39-C1]